MGDLSGNSKSTWCGEFNFSYIGLAISLGMLLFIKNMHMTDNSRKRRNGTECILCMECKRNCPENAL